MRGRRADGTAGRRSDGPTGRRSVGSTLVELLVVLAVLGVLLGLSAVSLSSIRPPPSVTSLDSLRSARASAVRTGRPIVVMRGTSVIRFLPDGRVLGGILDPLTGELSDGH